MAKFQAILGNLAGSVAGNTWSRNKGGVYVRRRAVPTNPNSARQQAARSILGSLAGQWATLSSTQRQQWRDYAEAHPVQNALGESIALSGQQWYVGLNARVLDIGGTPAQVPPVTLDPLPLTSATATPAAATVSIAFAPTPVPADHSLVVWQTIPGSLGRDPNRRQARLAGYVPAGVTPLVANLAFAMQVGETSNFYVGILNDLTGQVSVPLKARATRV
jgi:hypothetical protein